jgi:cytoskeletal protein CcmA (bactofilin family)
MDSQKPPADAPEPTDENALEAPANDENALESEVVDTTADGTSAVTALPPPKRKSALKRFNIYIVLFLFIVVTALAIIAVAYFQSKKASTTSTIKTQSLTQNTLDQVAASDATVGSSGQVLNVESSAVFAGQVLVRDDLQVAGSLQIGGAVALSDVTVSGTSDLGQVSVSQNLAIAGNTAIQGTASIAKSLQVNGAGTFSGAVSAPQLTTSSFQLNSDLTLTHHLIAGGASPGRNPGPALGSGGSASVGGSDTAGTVSINTGSAPAAGCFVTVTFSSTYASTPHVLLTPVGPSAGGLAYYVVEDSDSFSICDATVAPSGSSFGFNYFVVD